MKTLIVFFVMILYAGIVSGQSLKKGSLISIHVEDVKLAPGATIDYSGKSDPPILVSV